MGTKYSQLTNKERYSIDLLLQENYQLKDIAERLGRSKSTISREIKRNKVDGKYIGEKVVKLTISRRFREHKTKFTCKAVNIIKEKLRIGCSPEQISAHLKHKKEFGKKPQ